jgi:hypothetical protein
MYGQTERRSRVLVVLPSSSSPQTDAVRLLARRERTVLPVEGGW